MCAHTEGGRCWYGSLFSRFEDEAEGGEDIVYPCVAISKLKNSFWSCLIVSCVFHLNRVVRLSSLNGGHPPNTLICTCSGRAVGRCGCFREDSSLRQEQNIRPPDSGQPTVPTDTRYGIMWEGVECVISSVIVSHLHHSRTQEACLGPGFIVEIDYLLNKTPTPAHRLEKSIDVH